MREIACGEKEKYKKEQGHIMEETENKNTHSFLPDNFEKRRRFVTFSDDTCLSVRQFSLAACGKPWNSPPPSFPSSAEIGQTQTNAATGNEIFMRSEGGGLGQGCEEEGVGGQGGEQQQHQHLLLHTTLPFPYLTPGGSGINAFFSFFFFLFF